MWLIMTYFRVASAFKGLLNIVVLAVVLICVLQNFVLIGNIPGMKMPALK
jgi:hypothetical protein